MLKFEFRESFTVNYVNWLIKSLEGNYTKDKIFFRKVKKTGYDILLFSGIHLGDVGLFQLYYY